MYSEDPESIKDAYEFLLDDTTGNFYQRCDAKLNHLRDSANRLQAELITIQSETSIAKTIDHLSAHINEFSNVAKDILYTLRDDGELIDQRLKELEALEYSKFYKDIAKHIEGVTADDQSQNNLIWKDGLTEKEAEDSHWNALQTIFLDGELLVDESLATIRKRLHQN